MYLLMLLIACAHTEDANITENTAVVNVTQIIEVRSKGEQSVTKVTIPKDFLNHPDFEKTDSRSQLLWRVKLHLTSPNTSVRAILQHGVTTQSFKLPYTRTTDRKKTSVTAPLPARTIDLCPNPEEPIDETSTLQVTLVSSSSTPVTVLLTPQLAFTGKGWRNASEGVGVELNDTLSLSSSLVRTSFFKPPEGANYLQLDIDSLHGSDCFCAVVSVQQPKCPNFDSVSTATRFGIWQTMAENTSMVLNASEFPDGVLIVVVAAESDDFCRFVKNKCTEKRDENLEKQLRIRLKPVKGDQKRTVAVVAVICIYLFIMIGSLVLSEVQFRYKYNLFEGIDKTSILPVIAFAASMTQLGGAMMTNSLNRVASAGVEEAKRKKKAKLSNMCQKVNDPERTESMYKKNDMFLGNLLVMSVFYSIAVFQLAFQSAAKQRESGNYDICYFNSKCQIPAGPFLDFNHFFSNLGYVVFGLLFTGIVYRRNQLFHSLLKESEKTEDGAMPKTSLWLANLENNHGVPTQCGIYYTMGGALAMEGFMSASYHVCPTTVSFQFDTTFMYLMTILVYTKLYQNRHPDTSANALQVYLVLGGALILEALALYFSSAPFWVIFCLIYMVTLVLLVSNMYQLNTERHRKGLLFVRVAKLLWKETVTMFNKMKGKEVPKIRPLLVFLTITCVLNISMCIFFAAQAARKEIGASNYLLLMFSANTAIYLIYYVVMKYVSKERLCLQAKLYLGFTKLCFLPALYFFVLKEKNTDVSPAESRDQNKDCALLNFFDGHDIWHFLGGAGLFFAFMFLLRLDEDIKYKKRSKIPVF